MSKDRRFAQVLFSIATVFSMALSLAGTDTVSASSSQQSGDGLKRALNPHTGKLGFLSSDNTQPASAQTLGVAPYSASNQLLPSRASRSFDPAMSLVQHYGTEFGLQDPGRELSLMRTDRPGGSRVVTRYQQVYKGIPIMAGELIVNTDSSGDLYSMSGDLSPNLSLPTNPSITASAAQGSALAAVAEYYQRPATDFQASTPALWIYDEGIFQPDSKLPPQLVWRMNVTPLNTAGPIDELVLIDARTGTVTAHFNQVDTVLPMQRDLQDDPTGTPADTPTDVPPATYTPPLPTGSPYPTNTEIVSTHTGSRPTPFPRPTKTSAAPTPTLIPTTRHTATPTGSLNRNNMEVNPATAITRYVSPGGSDAGNTCASSASPCLTIQNAVNQSSAGDTINVASGTYTFAGSGNPTPNVVIINQTITLSGGWDTTFSIQSGVSTVDGQSTNQGLLLNNLGTTTTVDRFVIENSHSGDGAGIYLYGADLILTRSTIESNVATEYGGGIFLIKNASLTMTNSTIAGNTAAAAGGGIYVTGTTTGTTTIQFSTIAYNAVTSGSGGGVWLPTTGTAINNTILGQNSAGTGPDCRGKITSSNHNVINSTSGCTVTKGTGDQFGVDPKIAASLSDTPPLYALLSGSPAIDKGNDTGCPSTDERGAPRPMDGDGNGTKTCDIGAYEYPGAGVPAAISVFSGNNQQQQVDQTFDSPLVVLVLDGFGSPVNNATVTFTAPSTGAGGTFASSSSNTEVVSTNASGIAASSAFTANSTVGSYQVSATVSGSAASFSLQNQPAVGAPASVTINGGNNQQGPVGQAFGTPLSVLVRDGYGNPVPSGIGVTFTAPALSGASGTFASTSGITENAFTDPSGIASSSAFTANGILGSYNISAVVMSVPSLTANFSMQNQPAHGVPATISIHGGNDQQIPVGQAFANPLSILVKDAYGDPVPSGISVIFSAPAAGASGAFGTYDGSTPYIQTVQTDSSGIATSSAFTANGTPGSYAVAATVSGIGSPANFSLHNLTAVGVPAGISVFSGNNQSRMVGNAFANPLEGLVVDSLGDPVNGASVTFSAPASGAGGTFAGSGTNSETVTTDPSGVATASTFTANSTVGQYTVTAAVAGVALPVDFSLKNLSTGRFVDAATGSDSNDCSSVPAACQTIQRGIALANSGDAVYVAAGTYPGGVTIANKNLTLSGGWDSTFSTQNGSSIIDGQKINAGVWVGGSTSTVASLDHFVIENSNGTGVMNYATLTISDSSIHDNTGTNYGGGGIWTAGSLTLNNTTVSHNSSTGYNSFGGGIYAAAGDLTLNNVTVAYNRGYAGGGIYGNYLTTVRNSIIARNTAVGYGPDCVSGDGSHPIALNDYDLIGSTGNCNLASGSTDHLNVDPELSAYPMGASNYYPLLPPSPAIDAGNPAAPGSGGNACTATDQRGISRSQPGDSRCDIGAYEVLPSGSAAALGIASGSNQYTAPFQAFPQPLVVYAMDDQGSPVPGVTVTFTAPGSGPSGTFANGTTSTQAVTDNGGDAIASTLTANAQVGAYNVVASTSSLSVNLAVMNAAWYVAPTGSDANSCASPSTPCLTINNAVTKAKAGDTVFVAAGTYTGSGTQVVTIGKTLILSGGWDPGFSTQNDLSIIDSQNARGGIAALCNTGLVTIDHFSIENGYANTEGSGIYSSNCSLSVNHTVVHNNYAGISADGNLTLNNSTIENNIGVTGAGGIQASENYVLTISNSTITENQGGGIQLSGVSGQESGGQAALIVNSTITKNTARTGGGIQIGSSSPVARTVAIKDTIIANNSATSGPDCSGKIDTSDHNLIGNTAGCTFGISSGDKIIADPKMSDFPVGTPPYYALLSGSPAIDAGNPSTCLASDERGVTRPQGATCDIGAYEYVAPLSAALLGISNGSFQSTPPNAAFAQPLVAYVVDGQGNPVSGVGVTFTAPFSGPTGTFANGTNTVSIDTDSSGLAAATTFTANSQYGSYDVNVTASGLSGSVNIRLTNESWYVAPPPLGSDSNPCNNPAQPCQTINRALGLALPGDYVYVAAGTYTSATNSDVVTATEYVHILGGWDASFTAQNGQTLLDGRHAGNGLSSFGIVDLSQVTLQNGYFGIYNTGILNLSRVAIINNNNGIYNNGYITVVNSTISGNSGTQNPGTAIENDSGTVNLQYSTISNNNGLNNYAIQSTNPSAHIEIGNSILAGNLSGDCQVLTGSNITSDGHNLFGSSPACTSAQSPAFTPDSTDQIGVDPQVGPLLPLGYQPVLAGSPAIDAAGANCPATDQRGLVRPQDGDHNGSAICDIGAYEYAESSGSAALIGVDSGSNQRAAPQLAFAKPLVAYVIDDQGNPVAGATVTFTSPASGPGCIFSDTHLAETTAITDSGGLATSAAVTANTQLGTYNVEATVAGASDPASFALTNFAWFVSPTGTDSNACSSGAAPCLTINGALYKPGFTSGDGILVASGTYGASTSGPIVSLTRNVFLSGGWDSTFSTQSGMATIDGQDQRQDVTIARGVQDTIDHFIIQYGSATNGADVYNQGSLTITNSTIQGGVGSNGVGIYDDSGSTLTLLNSTVRNNVSNPASFNGGGIYHTGNQLTIRNSTISNNMAEFGAGIYINAGTALLNNDTIFQNTAESITTWALGGGIYSPNGANVTLGNTLVAGNGSDLSPDCYGSIASAGNNLIGNGDGCAFQLAGGDLLGNHSVLIHPQLGALTNNGGPTSTHALLNGSPAIDAGNNATCESTDQRGVARPQGASCDIGAYEGADSGQTSTPIIRTFNAGHQQIIPGSFACDQSTPCSDPDAASVQNYTTLMQQFYLSKVGRNGIDGNNAPFISTVHFDTGYDNAFWSGAQMVYGDGHEFAQAPDIIGHELTHGVTQYGSNLYDYYQSGAIDESLSDIWGEAFKQVGGPGGTPLGASDPLWEQGVDVTGLGPFRSLSNPPAFGDPDRMQSPLYDFDLDRTDGGGVHHNNGINNKAAYLLMEGGTFNGKTVTALGIDRTLAIYYEVQMNLLTSGANYLDLYNALYQGCLDVVGTHGITTADCQQVQSAADAVQMNLPPLANYIRSASFCPTGTSKATSDLFYDNFEGGLGNWNLGANAGSQRWGLSSAYASSGVTSLYADDYDPDRGDQDQTSDTFAAMASSVSLPAGSKSYLYFKQAFGFEYDSHGNYDGGVLEYSIDNGSTWKDAHSLFSAGQNYGGTIFTLTTKPAYLSYDNPLHGRTGFVKDSHGYVSSAYNLTSLAGKAVMFRWRLGTDFMGYGDLGWNVDDVRIYQCLANPGAPGLSLPANGSLSSTYLPTLDWKDATPAGGSYELQVATNNQFQPVALDVPSLSASTYSFTSALDPNTTYYWRVQATSLTGQVSPWSPVWSFRTVLLPPALSLPASGTYVQTTFPTLSWSDPNTSGVTGYTIQISKNNTFTSIVTTGTSTIPSYTPAKALPINSTLYWRVQVKGGNGPSLWSSSPAWSFLTGNGPSIPVPLSPANNSLTTSYTNPAFTWKASIAPSGTSFDHYQIQIGTDTSFSSPVTDATTTVPSYPSSLTLLPDTTYSWHVRAYNTIGDFSGWSATWSLRTALPPPTLTAPATGTDPLTLRPTFSWNAVGPGASSYSIQVSKNDSFTQLVLSAVTTTPNLTPAKDLPAASVAPILYWHVQAQGPNGPSLWSSPARTITSPNPPSIPVPTSPANGSLSTSPVYQPTLSWKAVTLPSLPSPTTFGHYHVQVATSNTFASTVVDDTSVSTITYPQLLLPAALNPNTTYYWRVSAVNSANEASAWSATWSFRTLLAPPILLSPADTATGVPARPAFTWGDPNTSGVTGYTIQISKSSTFASILLAGSTTATTRTFTPTSNLASGTQYFWRVQVKGTNGPSAWPTYFSFSTQ